MAEGKLEVVLTCGGCGRIARVLPWFRMTKMSVLRAEGGSTGWYVDGARVLCGGCAGDLHNSAPQRETWGEYDQRAVEELRDD